MRTRTVKKNIWLNYNEDRQLKDLARLLNVSEASIIRKLLFDTSIKGNPPREFYRDLEKINKIGVNINQLTKIANTTNVIYVIELRKYFKKIEDLIELIKEKYL